ncbi:MAG: hypothetical protein L3J23_00940 [Flavobacteriaceae bacterium]|nr:hypothetical protein [Flavobacteriaceae bacterium]
MKKIKNRLTLIFGIISFVLVAQESTTYTYSANLKNDSIIGFKKIVLSPKLRVIANNDFSDLRILDTKNQQTPYFIQNFSYQFVDAKFIPIKYKQKFEKKQSIIYINNATKKIHNTFTFKLSNTNVRKNCKIEGSNNHKNWFVVSEKIYLNLSKNTNNGSHYYNINFPSIDYSTIRLVINDSISAPIHIKEVGYFNKKKVTNKIKYQTLDYTYKVEQKENLTLIYVSASKNYEINTLNFEINKPKLFNRKATIYYNKENKHFIKSINLNSKSVNNFDSLNIKQKEFIIEIDNKDNQPLQITNIIFQQKEKYLVSDLKINQKYTVVSGNKKLKKPSYDLVDFKNEIAYNLPILKLINEKIKIENKPIIVKKIPFYEKSWFMWLSLGLGGLIILLFTISLLKKTNDI